MLGCALKRVNIMYLYEFLIHLLDAQAKTLQRLAALFGEDILMQMLEAAGEKADEEGREYPGIDPNWFKSPAASNTEGAYSELEDSVRSFKLPAVLEFHLWAYPGYRGFIESSLELGQRINPASGEVLVDETVRFAMSWVRTLPIPGEFMKRAESAAQVPWVRYRTEVLKKIGKRPLGAIE